MTNFDVIFSLRVFKSRVPFLGAFPGRFRIVFLRVEFVELWPVTFWGQRWIVCHFFLSVFCHFRFSLGTTERDRAKRGIWIWVW